MTNPRLFSQMFLMLNCSNLTQRVCVLAPLEQGGGGGCFRRPPQEAFADTIETEKVRADDLCRHNRYMGSVFYRALAKEY
jgi:hypothetical protein